MSNPSNVACPANAWTKVLDNKISGEIVRISSKPYAYLYCRKDNGEAAPVGQGAEGSFPIFTDDIRESFGATVGSDVYIYPVGIAGIVMVDA